MSVAVVLEADLRAATAPCARCVDVSVIAYYCGGPDAPGVSASSKVLRPAYLEETVRTTRRFSRLVVIGICNPYDRPAAIRAIERTEAEGGACVVWTIEKAVDPMMLPIWLCRRLQEHCERELTDGAVVCYNEADQLLNVSPAHTRFLLSRPPEERASLTGHRIEEILLGAKPQSPMYEIATIAGRRFKLANEPLGEPRPDDVDGWYRQPDFMMAYSACFVCTARTLCAVVFVPIFWPEVLIETPQIIMVRGGTPWKTRRLTACGEETFATVHLSGSTAMLPEDASERLDPERAFCRDVL